MYNSSVWVSYSEIKWEDMEINERHVIKSSGRLTALGQGIKVMAIEHS